MTWIHRSEKKDLESNLYFTEVLIHKNILPYSCTRNVLQTLLATLNILGKNGGYIFAPSQILQGEIPPENIDRMYNAAKMFKPDLIL